MEWKMNLDDIDLDIDVYQLNWSVVWWFFLSFYWLLFAIYVIQANKTRQLLVFTLFSIMSGSVALLSTNMKEDLPKYYQTILLGFSIVLMGIVYFHKVSRGKRFGPLIFQLLVLLQLAVNVENFCKLADYPTTARPFEGQILNVDVYYSKKYAGDTPMNGKYKMHITCRGTGKTLVILEPGIPFTSVSLSGVAQSISKKYSNTTTCTYDRLGYGWSDRTINSRSTLNMVNELRSLMAEAKQNNKRMIYIGWSFGGLVAQLYSRLYPKEMLGLILVDSMDHNVLGDNRELEEEINKGRHMFTLSKALAPIGLMRLVGFLGLLPPECGFPISPSLLPQESSNAMRALFFSQDQFLDTAFDELDDLVNTLNQSHDLLGSQPKIPENIPTVVLRANLSVSPYYLKSHKRLLRLSTKKVELITNKSNHYIPMRDPESIVNALQALFIIRKANP